MGGPCTLPWGPCFPLQARGFQRLTCQPFQHIPHLHLGSPSAPLQLPEPGQTQLYLLAPPHPGRSTGQMGQVPGRVVPVQAHTCRCAREAPAAEPTHGNTRAGARGPHGGARAQEHTHRPRECGRSFLNLLDFTRYWSPRPRGPRSPESGLPGRGRASVAAFQHPGCSGRVCCP